MSQQPTGDWTLYYWGITGRGQFVRVILDDAGVEYKEINDPNEISKMTYSKGKNENKGWGSFAVPIIKHGDLLIGQTNTCVRYAATKNGLLPKNEGDAFHADQIMANIQDLFSEMFKQSKEPVEAKTKFMNSRFALWMQLFSDSLGKNDWFFGNACSYADLVMWVVLEALIFRITKEKYDEFVTKKFKNLDDLRQRVGKRDGVQKLVKRGIKNFGEPWKWS